MLDTRTTNVKVHNLSQHQLTSTEQLVLSKNLKFIPTPKPMEVNILAKAVFNLVRNIRIFHFFQNNNNNTTSINDEFEQFKIKFHVPNPEWQPPFASMDVELFIDKLLENTSNYIKQHEHDNFKTKLNLSPTEFRALKDLIHNKSIIVKPSDKNAGITVMDRNDFISESMKHLNNSKNYKEISEQQCQLLADEIKLLTASIFTYNNYSSSSKPWFNVLSKYCLNNINLKSESTFYVLPKVHKTPMSTRPILACHSAILQNFSQFLAFCIQPHVEKVHTYVKNSRDFLTKLRNLKLDKNKHYWLVSGDIDSMYPNIDLNIAFNVISKLYSHSNIKKALSQSDFNKLLWALLNQNLIAFNGKFFVQISGLPMGSSAAPPVAILVVNGMEVQNLDPTFPVIWTRYIDDIFLIFDDKTKMDAFLQNYNNMHPSIKVNWKIGKSVEYLDIGIQLDSNNNIITYPFQKPMSIFQYIPFQSFHKPDQKLNWITAELERFWFISSQFHHFNQVCYLFWHRLRQRGYPSHIIAKIFNNFKFSHWDGHQKLFPQKPQPSTQQHTFFLKLEYNPTWMNFKLQMILPTEIPNPNWKFIISWSNPPNMGKKLVKAKLPKLENLPNLENATKQQNS
jgi:reverse transcriptase-like protein